MGSAHRRCTRHTTQDGGRTEIWSLSRGSGCACACACACAYAYVYPATPPRPRPLTAPRKAAPPMAWRESVCSGAGAHTCTCSDKRITLCSALKQTRSCPVGESTVPGRRTLVGAQLERVTVVNLSKPVERTPPGTVYPNVKNGLWVSVMCQCFIR